MFKLMKMRCCGISSRHYRPLRGSQFPFIVLRTKIFDVIHRGYLFFSVKDRNLFHRVDTIG